LSRSDIGRLSRSNTGIVARSYRRRWSRSDIGRLSRSDRRRLSSSDIGRLSMSAIETVQIRRVIHWQNKALSCITLIYIIVIV
jgi:hypothetical protein